MVGEDGAPRGRLRADRARQVSAVLRERVKAAPAGWLLPSEDDLRRDFQVSRNTVREALNSLRREGLVARRQGVGTVVTGTRHTLRLGPAEGLSQALAGAGTVTNHVRTQQVVTPPSDVAARLVLTDGAETVYVERVRLLDDRPLSLDFTYLPIAAGLALVDEDLSTGDLYARIEAATGRSLGDTQISVEATLADDFVASVLQVPRRAAILLVTRMTYWADGTPADIEYHHIRGEAVALLFDGVVRP